METPPQHNISRLHAIIGSNGCNYLLNVAEWHKFGALFFLEHQFFYNFVWIKFRIEATLINNYV